MTFEGTKNKRKTAVATTTMLLVIVVCSLCPLVEALALHSSPPYCINLKCTLKSERRDEFVSVVRQNQRLTLQDEPKALQYVFGQDVEDVNTFYIHEQFTDKEGFAFHRETPHNVDWQAFKKTDPFLVEPVVNFYHGTHQAPQSKVPLIVHDDVYYCLNVQLSVDPTMRSEFLAVIEENARGSNQDEPLCLQYVWGEDCDEANTFHFHEEYTGEDGGRGGFEAHSKTKHFAAWETFASKDPFTRPPIVSFYRTLLLPATK